MIPIELTISGFLSYRNTVTIDFRNIHIACIAGANGAGKSSILDAFTWALFGKARKDDESIINTQSDAADVRLTFAYEGNIYRVQRINPRGKPKVLEFFIQSKNEDGEPAWKPLTERRLRDTQAFIERTIGMDYDTFVNASFFLQGKADEFTKQTPSKRKEILSSILKLEVWEAYRQRTAERRKKVETQISILDAQIQGIHEEIATEEERTENLKRIQKELEQLTAMRITQEKTLESINRTKATLDGQRQVVNNLQSQLDARQRALEAKEKSLEEHLAEKKRYENLLQRADEIRESFDKYQKARAELERWNETAQKFHNQEKKRQAPLQAIAAEKARLEQERRALEESRAQNQRLADELPQITAQIQKRREEIAHAQAQLEKREQLKKELEEIRQKEAEAKAENPRLRDEMHEIKARIDALKGSEAQCPTCGKPLSGDEKQNLLQSLEKQGKAMGDKFRANKKLLEEIGETRAAIAEEIAKAAQFEAVLRDLNRALDQLVNRQAEIEKKQKEWETNNAPRLAQIVEMLEKETFAPEARKQLAEINAELKAIGYDAAIHDQLRQEVSRGAETEAEYHALERAQAALQPLERSIGEINAEIQAMQSEIKAMQAEYDEYVAKLAAAEAELPDIAKAQADLLRVQENENRVRMELGRAQQLVEAIKIQKENLKKLHADREELATTKSQYEQLERAFGRNGVPALLIEQALPEIENKANEILQRLSGGGMSIRFITQRKLKDKKRKDLKDTLDIQISDSAGVRDYEMYSGGESFRVNFAIRLALSEILAKRAGGRLQTLVIDEGFGSQDEIGRQRLLEAINMVSEDFEKILVITHIDELKDAFPARIQVEKLPSGSQIRII